MPKNKDRLEIAVKEYIKGVYIEHTPKFTWATAMIKAGYSESHTNGQGHLVKGRAQKLLREAKKKLFKDQRYNLEDWEQELQLLTDVARENNDRTNWKGAIDSGIKLNGGFIDRSINLNADIPTDPIEYKLWLQKELDRLNNSDKVIESYAKSRPAIAQRY